jgi:hypothetical protein
MLTLRRWLLSSRCLLPALLLGAFVAEVRGLPSGAAGCDCCAAAAFGFHLDFGPGSNSGRTGQRGRLSLFQITLTINNVTMVPNTRTTFPGGVDLNWTVTALNDTLPFRGILLRAQPTILTVPFTLTGDSNLWDAQACFSQVGNVEGITHRTRVQKRNASGTMRFDKDGPVLIDLTIVLSNGRVAPGDTSVYGYDGFELAITGSPPIAPSPPAPVPFVAPIPPPVNLCTTNTCSSLLGIPGRLYNKFSKGKCKQKCTPLPLLAPEFLGWRCGGCF